LEIVVRVYEKVLKLPWSPWRVLCNPKCGGKVR